MALTPEELRARAKARLEEARIARHVTKQLEGWQVVAKYHSKSSDAVHTVEQNGSEYRCTCQGFRIYKRGYCKHTKLAEQQRFTTALKGATT